MNYRDFVEGTKDAVSAVAMQAVDRPITPMLHMHSPIGLEHTPIDPSWFRTAPERALLVAQACLLVKASEARLVGWTFTAQMEGEVVIGVFVDRERHEVWQAPVERIGALTLVAGWQGWPPNEAEGLLIQPIQEVLR